MLSHQFSRKFVMGLIGDRGIHLYQILINCGLIAVELLLQPLFKLAKSRIILEYDGQKKTDGVGAQLQRIMGIYGLAIRYGFSFRKSKISSLAIHPLDPYQTKIEMSEFLDKLNAKYELPSTEEYEHFDNQVFIDSLNIKILTRVSLKALLTNKKYLLSIVEPYPLLEIHPNSYLFASKYLMKESETHRFETKTQQKLKIVIHHRYGVGGMTVQKGEKIPREMPIEYFEKCISFLVKKHGVENISEITVLSDAPQMNLEFIPPVNQGDLWKSSPKFIDEKLQVKGVNLESLFVYPGIRTQIVSGGDPMLALDAMAHAHYLIMSRSSLSYVGALLNSKGQVIFPPLFWHKPLKRWLQNIG
jgi:hypothetical protein